MAGGWIEKLTGSLDDKRRYKRHKARVQQLPEPYRETAEAVERYLMYSGGISDGATLVRMLDDLDELFEQSATDGTPIRDVVGENPVEFVETFLANYSEAQWISKERARLTRAVDRAAAATGATGDRGDPGEVS
ncbi:DUF1048 domain-containing protein [Herbiconiux sp. KACC 21604]|uniref:DUF1048 domain-containing protein n=1 Tax=unclassified Herbiconiux TaxID=2618217 RepID=UPI001490F6EC|nr:DUF1048 domain-containing protein [Herbiconiux sp. SALV-R1]QJU52263.1 DUF1048 domain-containing protein [Herbiconiux sp. SALV-R1]WPO87108.1 DUF1048 domain-containing protein [Herbiconiux sp. KACC 21604]